MDEAKERRPSKVAPIDFADFANLDKHQKNRRSVQRKRHYEVDDARLEMFIGIRRRVHFFASSREPAVEEFSSC